MLNAIPIFLGDPALLTPHYVAGGTVVLLFALMAALPRLLVWLLPDLQ